jgi:hypothetical protein
MINILSSITFLLAIVSLITGLKLAGPKVQITTDLITMMAIIANKLLGAMYIIGALIVFALLLHH